MIRNDNRKITCIAIDDGASSLEILSGLIGKIPFLDLLGTYTNPLTAISFINSNKVDLIFSEVEMNGLNGIQLINSLKIKPLVILISVDEKYAIEGYNVDALDYILKPISFERLLKAVNKAHDVFFSFKGRDLHNIIEPQYVQQDIIFVKSDYRILKLNINDILFIEGFNDYVKIHLSNSNPVLTLLNLRTLEEKLPARVFVRVHRSYIVSLQKIDSIEKKRIKIGKRNIPISHSYFDAFFTLIEKLNIWFY
jgi:two-component system, LytTR family, response regulator